MSDLEELKFKFQIVTNGQASGFLAKKGFATEEALVLGKERVDYNNIADTTTRDNRILISMNNGETIVLEVSKVKAATLEKFIDRAASLYAVQNTQKRLQEEGNIAAFRAMPCPHCKAMIDLSELDSTEYVYCRFCESILDNDGKLINKGDSYRICDDCGLFNQVKGYSEFYFYFLVFVYGYSSKRRHMCNHCAGSMSIKLFITNLIFVLGVPNAIYVKIKSMTGRDPKFIGINKANALAKKGKFEAAAEHFKMLHENVPNHPGLLYNEGMGQLNGQNPDGVQTLVESINHCCNYEPSMMVLHQLHQASQE